MRLYIINPDYGIARKDMDDRCGLLQRCVGPDVSLSMDCLTKTRVDIDSACDVVRAAPEILDMAAAAERTGYDAVILYCFSDPAIDACRERLCIPVVGGAQAACLIAPWIARRSAVLLADTKRIPEKSLFLRTLGLDPCRIQQVGAADLGGADPWADRNKTLAALAEAGEKLCAEGAEAIILGCLSFLGLAAPLSARLGVPVIDPAAAAVSVAESLVRQGLFTSKISYPSGE